MEEKEKKKQIAKISIFITSIFVIFLSVTYAFVNLALQGSKKQVITAGDLSLELQEENNIVISDAFPIADEVGMIQEPFPFRLVNNTTNVTSYILKLVDITTGDKLSTSNVKYGLTKDGEKRIALLSTLSDGVIDSGTIAGNQTIEYALRFWVDFDVTDDSVIFGKSLSYRIDVEVSQVVEKEKITIAGVDFDLEDSTFVPDFSQISSATNGRGLYKLPTSVPTETGNDVYYYRGAVEDNHVLFANICWEIVRTTETGGIKMIYDGLSVDGVCSNTGEASQLPETTAFNGSFDSLAYNGYMYGTVYSYLVKSSSDLANNYIYGNDVEWDGTNYILKNTITATGNWETDYSNVGDAHHYTCFTTGDTCSSVYYVFFANSSDGFYIVLNSGKKIEEAISEMQTNTTNSTIKNMIDDWYKLNIEDTGYTEYLEDTVWCNDRSVENNMYGGWVKDGDGTDVLRYSSFSRLASYKTPSLVCSNHNDKFTVEGSNGNGALTYPVGLLTADEIALAGGVYCIPNSDYYLNTGKWYWSISPADFIDISFLSYQFNIYSNGFLSNDGIFQSLGVRPVISLKSGTKFAESGDGTATNPYVVE